MRIGHFAMMRGGSGASKDVPPFCINDGISRLRAINVVGLRRNGFDDRRIRAIKEAFKFIFRSGLRLQEALAHWKAIRRSPPMCASCSPSSAPANAASAAGEGQCAKTNPPHPYL